MTREEAIARIKNHKIAHKMNEPRAIYISEALDMAIKALETESSCEGAISRQAVLDEAFEVDTKEYGRIEVVGVDAINSLPPVTPQPKTGHWVHGEYCSECGCDVPAYIIDWKWQRDMKE